MSSSQVNSVQLKGFRLLNSTQGVDYESRSKQKLEGYVNNAYNDDIQAHNTSQGEVVNVKVVSTIDTTNISFDTAPSSLTDEDTNRETDRAISNELKTSSNGEHNKSDEPVSETTSSGGTYEPFDIVWRDLAYEIELNTLVQNAKDTLKNMKNIITNSSKDRNIAPENNIKPFSNGLKNNSSNLKANPKSQTRVIFDNLNGYARSGEITAILGPSGAGKTSLLNAICGFETQNYRGSLQLLGGRHRKRMKLSIIPQKDYLIENLTVKENLQYSSRILNVDKNFDHDANIERVIKVLNLENCFTTHCKNLSGGEYKRASIAQELLRQPDILVLDEPTSGLDSLNCKRLVETLRDLIEASNQGIIAPMAIVMTIHQPDVEIFSMFDHVYCLAKGRRVIYDGHPGKTLDVLQQQGGLELIKKNSINPANLLIEVASGVKGNEETLGRLAAHQQRQFEEFFKATMCDDKFRDDKNLQQVNSNINDNKSQFYRDKRLDSRHKQRGLFWYHTGLLTRRAFRGTIRDPMVTVIALMFYILVPIVMWTVYSPKIGKVTSCPIVTRNISMLKLADESTETVFRTLQEDLIMSYEGSTMFFVTCYAYSMCSMALAALAFPLSMHILLKELRNGWFSLPTFVLAKTISNFPFEVLFPSASIMLVYFLIGMPPSYMQWRPLTIALVVALLSIISTAQGLVFGALFMDDTQAAIFLAIASSLPQVLLSGYTARVKFMPELLQHLSWTSMYRYSSESIAIIRYGHGMCTCEPETEAFLRDSSPQIEDIPSQMKPMIDYYYSNMRSTNAEIESYVADNSTDLVSYGEDFDPVPGISYSLLADSALEKRVVEQINANELDIFKRVAQVVSKSLTFGRDYTDCKSLRSELLAGGGLVQDDWLPFMIMMMVVLVVSWKIILYLVVTLKVRSRM